MQTINTPHLTIHIGTKNTSHILSKHNISIEQVISVIQSPDIVTKSGSSGLYYYAQGLVVICKRVNTQWFLSTAYLDDKPFVFGKVVYEKEVE